MITKYSSLKIAIIFLLLRKGKLSISKICNAIICYVAYWMRLPISGVSPFIINFELSNHCNENCVFCRTDRGEIFDQNPLRKGGFIEKGLMRPEIIEDIIDQTSSTLLMAVPYVNGEPFIYKKLPRILKVLNDRKVASMISTNGILMSDKNINVILDNNLDLIKVHVSGFTNHIHQIQHRVGNVDVIKRNLSLLQQRIVERSSKLIVVVDYILYNHNEHEVAQFRDFTEKLGFRFSVRPGNPLGMEDTEAKQPETPAQHIPCDWLWKALTVNWNGDMLPCCDYVVWGGAKGYGRYERQTNKVRDIWNGSVIREMRRLHRSVGRSAIPICSDCNRQGIEYKF